jgi:hypothetical protein
MCWAEHIAAVDNERSDKMISSVRFNKSQTFTGIVAHVFCDFASFHCPQRFEHAYFCHKDTSPANEAIALEQARVPFSFFG